MNKGFRPPYRRYSALISHLLLGPLFIILSCSTVKKYSDEKPSESLPPLEWSKNREIQSETTTAPQASPVVETSVTPAPKDTPQTAEKPNAFYYFSLGEKDLEESQLDRAIENFKLAIIHDPDSAESYYRLAEAYTRKQMFPEAITAVKKSLKLDPEDVNAYLLLGGIYSASRMFDEAIKTYQKAIVLDPSNHEAKFVMAMIYAEMEKWTLAENLLKGILKNEPDHYFAIYYLGKVHEIQGNEKNAVMYYKRAVEIRPGLTPAARALSVIYEKQANYQSLIDLYQQILKEEPENAVVLKKLAQTYLMVDQYQKSKEFFQQYLEKEKDDVNSRITYGLLLLEIKEYKEANRIFRQLMVEFPDSDKVRYYLGMSYESLDQVDDAVDHFSKVPPDSEHYLHSMAHITFHLKKSNPEKALRYLSAALQGKPDLVQIYDLRAQVYEEMNKLSLTVNELEKGLEKNPKNEDMLYYLGTIHQKMGHDDLALATMEKILVLNGNNHHALNFVAYSYAERNIKLDEAEVLVRRALKTKPEDPYILDSLGWIYFKKGNYAQAVKELERACTMSPEESIILLHLGEVYLKLNLVTKATESLKKALNFVKDPKEKAQIVKLLGDSESTRSPSSIPSQE